MSCEYSNCTKRASIEWKAIIDHGDGPESHYTDRCGNHPVQDPRFTSTAIKQPLGQLHPVFQEALAPFMPALYSNFGSREIPTKPHEFSICCGAPITDDGRCTSCWEVA